MAKRIAKAKKKAKSAGRGSKAAKTGASAKAPARPSRKKAAPKSTKTPTKKKTSVRSATKKSARKTQEPPVAAAVEPDSLAGSGTADKAPAAKKRHSYATAESMARSQRSISISEFFAKNRHLLGFDSPRKALLTTVKEAVDNALDACEEAGILPEVEIRIEQLGQKHFKVIVRDNGPGIVKKQIPSIFGQLLYGSKFHRLKMSRGQQGIGISAAGMYGLLTTGQPVRITSRTSPRAKAHFYEVQIDTKKNRPDIIRDDRVEWDMAHGTQVEIELEARFQRGRQSVDAYLQQTAIANPHVRLTYHAPDGRESVYPPSVKQLPRPAKSIRPHPYGIELGVLIKMFQDTRAKSVRQFLTSEFSRVSPRVANEIIETSGIRKNARAKGLSREDAKAVYAAIQDTRILAPATDCVVPIGEEQLLAGLKQVVEADFYTANTRRPAVYRGNPFIIETALAYGKADKKDDQGEGENQTETPASPAKTDQDDQGQSLATVLRFANRVPFQYQQGACAIYKMVAGLNWRQYGLNQARGALPSGDLTIVVHMASVWVPFTSESKEAVASYPEILQEIRLGLQECGRRLARHIRKAVRVKQELKKQGYIEKYIPAIGEALRDILGLSDRQVGAVCRDLKDVLERSRKF